MIPPSQSSPIGCNSWVVIDRSTGKPVFETWSQHIAEAINQQKFEILTTYQWLARFNESIQINP